MKTLFTLVFLLIVTPAYSATTYYVATTGSNSNSCATAQNASTPKRTWTGASGGIACLSGGDTLKIAAGEYTSGEVVITSGAIPSGPSSLLPTRIEALTPNSWPHWRPAAPGKPDIGAVFISTSNIVFDGLDIDGANGTSHIFTFRSSQNFTIQNSKIHDSWGAEDGQDACFWSYSTAPMTAGFIARNNEIYDCASVAFYVSQFEAPLIERNYIHTIGAKAFRWIRQNVTDYNGGIVRWNFIENIGGAINGSAVCFYVGGGRNHQIYGNICKGLGYLSNSSSGSGTNVGIYEEGSFGGTANRRIYNNCFYDPGAQADGAIYLKPGSGDSSTQIRNNVFIGSAGQTAIGNPDGNTNLTNNTVSTSSATLWIDQSANRVSPIESSALIDAGSATNLPPGMTYVGAGVDRGCFEAPIPASGAVENATPTQVNVLAHLATQSVRSGVGLKNCHPITWAIVVASIGVTESSCGLTQTATANVGLASSVTNEQSVTASYTRHSLLANNITDNVCIGGELGPCLSAELRTFSPLSVTNNVAGGSAAAWASINHRWFHVESTIASAKWRGQENATNGTVMKGGYTATTIGVACTGGNCDQTGFQVYFACVTAISAFCISNGGTYVALTDDATTNGIAFGAYPGSLVFDGETISSALITDPHGSFVAGKVVGKQSTQPVVDLTQNSTTQLMALLKVASTASVGEQFCFQVKRAGGTDITQTNFPCLTVVNPSVGTGF